MSAGPGARGGGQAPAVVVQTSLDDLTSADVRFLQEAARLGPLHVRIPSDGLVERETGRPPKFPVAERRFLAASLRCVDDVSVVEDTTLAAMADLARRSRTLVLREGPAAPAIRDEAGAHGLACTVLGPADLAGYPAWDVDAQEVRPPAPGDPARAIVTGCYDWLHSGHLRFFMDAAAVGELYVVVGSDRNVELLKGPGHPLQHEEERRYMVGAVRSVHRCLVSSGSGWMDAEPEIAHIRPRFYVVNEDGDQLAKREFCLENGIEYVVLRRLPHLGLPARSSTDLRGF
jgi:cytidyltransferase-like protein